MKVLSKHEMFKTSRGWVSFSRRLLKAYIIENIKPRSREPTDEESAISPYLGPYIEITTDIFLSFLEPMNMLKKHRDDKEARKKEHVLN